MSSHTQPERILDSFVKPHGIDFDLQETFRKLSTSQFGGDRGRAFCELLQNAVDSYAEDVPMNQRRVALESAGAVLAVRDRGAGLDRDRLTLITQLGGTDKSDSSSRIGRFGIGFFSIFNPALGTRRVVVRTLCEGQAVRLTFTMDDAYPERPPAVCAEPDTKPHASVGTTIEVHFADKATVQDCLRSARKFLTYLPCPATLNGQPFCTSIWSQALRPDARTFEDAACSGFVVPSPGELVAVLCRYELICETSLRSLLRIGIIPSHLANEYRNSRFPYSTNAKTVVNCNTLNVTVSRDSIHADPNFRSMLDVLRGIHAERVTRILRETLDPELVCINQFILAEDIGREIAGKNTASQRTPAALIELIDLLLDAKVHRISGEEGCCSLREIAECRTRTLPIYYSPSGQYVRWLGGAFRHDFVVLPAQTAFGREVSTFYSSLFRGVFSDCVNLDTIAQDEEKLKELVERGLVASALLAPTCRFVGTRLMTPREEAFIAELNQWLAMPTVCDAVRRSLHLEVASVESGFFDMADGNITVATGLFEEDGRPFDNLSSDKEGEGAGASSRRLKLGVWRGHPLVRDLVETNAPERMGYALGFVAHQLIRCQHLLAPHTHFRHWVLNDLIIRLHAVAIEGFLDATQGMDKAPA